MNQLKPVSFKKPREHEPRLSKPYVPGKHDKRFWTEAEVKIVKQYFPTGGAVACLAHLPPHRSKAGIYGLTKKLGIKFNGTSKDRVKIEVPDNIDDRIRKEWSEIDPKKRGAVAELADQLGVPRWWLSARARNLGLTVARVRQPNWTAAEDTLLKDVPLHDPKRCAQIFREHGYNRSATGIVVRATRLNLSRRATRDTLSASAAGKILGIDSKSIAAVCISGDLTAGRRGSKRLPQQGGDAWAIKPADLRQYIIDYIERIDIRKVDKVAFVDLLVADQKGDE